MDGGDGCTIMWMYHWTVHLKIVTMVNFMCGIFYHYKNFKY